MPTTCCVFNCSSRGDRDLAKFYKIPKELAFKHRLDLNELSKNRRQQWKAIRRNDLSESLLSYGRVCSKHFLSGKPAQLEDYMNVDWVPTLSMGYGNVSVQLDKAKTSTLRKERAEKRKRVQEMEFQNEAVNISDDNESAKDRVQQVDQLEKPNDKGIQTEISSEDITEMNLSISSMKKLRAKIIKLEMGYSFFKDNDIKTKYYTGINSFNKLVRVFDLLKNHITVHFNSSLPAFEQFVMTLIKLKLNLDFKDLRFGISPSTASTCFKKIIEIMYHRFQSLIIWPDRDVLKTVVPTCFKETFGDKTTIIIDCFEVFIEKPSNLMTSAQTCSNYKHHHTIKYLIGITPQGSISFISGSLGW